MSIKSYSTTVASNTAIDSTPTADATMYPNHVPLAIRKLMADLKEYDDNAENAVALYAVTANGSTAYRIASHYGTTDDPTIYAMPGQTIAFDLGGLSGSHPFQIEDDAGTAYNTGLTHVADDGTVTTGSSAQGKSAGVLFWKIPGSIRGQYEYQCTSHSGMNGKIMVGILSDVVGNGRTETATLSANKTPDFAGYQNFVFTLGGNYTLSNPATADMTVGQSGVFVFIQDSTGSRTISLGSSFDTAGGSGLTLSTAASAIDVVPYYVRTTSSILLGAPQLAFS